MEETKKELEAIKTLYTLNIWPDDPRTKEGYNRYLKSIEKFRKAIKHDWFKELLSKKEELSVLEICAGYGIGGFALSKAIQEKGNNVKLTILDIREYALKIGKNWGERELKVNVNYIVQDARDTYKLKSKFDIALLYGFSTPHFNPWDMIRLLASLSETLLNESLFIVEEVDRIYNIFYLRGYKDILVEQVTEDEIVISVHAGYSTKKGSFIRAFKDLTNQKKNVLLDTYFWNLASMASLLWLFFRDVDFIPIETNRSGFIVAKRPRRNIKLKDVIETPTFLK